MGCTCGIGHTEDATQHYVTAKDPKSGALILTSSPKPPRDKKSSSSSHQKMQQVVLDTLYEIGSMNSVNSSGASSRCEAYGYGKTYSSNRVCLSIYDSGHSGDGTHHHHHIRKKLNYQQTDAPFHIGLEVYGIEWSYGFSNSQTSGVFMERPTKCPLHHYSRSVYLGDTNYTNEEVFIIIKRMRKEWLSKDYSIMSKNSCTFVRELAEKLGVNPGPNFLSKLAKSHFIVDRTELLHKTEEALLLLFDNASKQKPISTSRMTTTTTLIV